MSPSRLAAVGLALAACVLSTRPAAQTVSAISWLDRYARGEFEAVARDLEDFTAFEALLEDLKFQAPKWIEAGSAEDRARRRLAAVTFALEAARAAEWREWKWIQTSPAGTLPVLSWKPAPLLLEWGCRLIREQPLTRPIERVWQLAALAVAQRSEDSQFLIGITALAETTPAAQRRHPEDVVNAQDEIGHLTHAMTRFLDEPRFLLAQAIARERYTPSESVTLYLQLADIPGIGGEARVRLGAMHLRRGRTGEALDHFVRGERLTRDPWVLHLLWTFRGQALSRSGKNQEAIAAYRTARAIHPGGQTASLLLAEALFKAGERAESQAVAASILENSGAVDPYLELVHGDDRFWPQLIGKLRAELHRP